MVNGEVQWLLFIFDEMRRGGKSHQPKRIEREGGESTHMLTVETGRHMVCSCLVIWSCEIML